MLSFCANISWLFSEFDFPDRFAAASEVGFSAVEFYHAEGTDPATVVAKAAEAGLKIALFNCWIGDFFEGGPGLSGVPGREQEFRQAVDQICAFGAAVGGDAGVQIGPSRVPDGGSRQQCLEVFVENLKYASAELARVNCRVMVEPMNAVDFPGILIPDVPSAFQAMTQAGVGNLYLQFDCYHEAMSGGDVVATIRRIHDQIEHFQFADVPGRAEPGSGNLDIQEIFRTLDEVGYDKFVAAEYQPTGGSDESLEWLRTYQSSTCLD